MNDPIGVLAELFAVRGADAYLGEPVTQAAHMLQTAALAEAAGACGAQGGAMTGSEVVGFALLPYSQDAVALRRWDEAAKDPHAVVAPLSHYEPLLRSLLTR